MYINWGHYVIYLQNMKLERLILWPGGAYTDTMHFLIHESWLHMLIGKYPKWATKLDCFESVRVDLQDQGYKIRQVQKWINTSITANLGIVKYYEISVADPGGCRRRAPPPKGPDSFVLTYKFFET